jgi:hypothetical protein
MKLSESIRTSEWTANEGLDLLCKGFGWLVWVRAQIHSPPRILGHRIELFRVGVWVFSCKVGLEIAICGIQEDLYFGRLISTSRLGLAGLLLLRRQAITGRESCH